MPLHDQGHLPLKWPHTSDCEQAEHHGLYACKLLPPLTLADCCHTLLLQGYSAVRFQRSDANALWKLREMPPDQFGRAWQLSDVDCDGALSQAEFILFMYIVGSFTRK